MILLILYALVVAGAGLASTLRREMTVLRGGTVLAVHAALLTLQAVLLAFSTLVAGSADGGGSGIGWSGLAGGEGMIGAAALAAFAALTAASSQLRDTWLVSGFDDGSFRSMLEQSLRQLLIPFEREVRGYALTLRTATARVALRAIGTRRALIRFESDGAPPKKLVLLRSLLAKRLGRLVPRPRIRFE